MIEILKLFQLVLFYARQLAESEIQKLLSIIQKHMSIIIKFGLIGIFIIGLALFFKMTAANMNYNATSTTTTTTTTTTTSTTTTTTTTTEKPKRN